MGSNPSLTLRPLSSRRLSQHPVNHVRRCRSSSLSIACGVLELCFVNLLNIDCNLYKSADRALQSRRSLRFDSGISEEALAQRYHYSKSSVQKMLSFLTEAASRHFYSVLLHTEPAAQHLAVYSFPLAGRAAHSIIGWHAGKIIVVSITKHRLLLSLMLIFLVP